MMELAASPRIARKPSRDGAADAGLPGTTLLNACTKCPGSMLLFVISWAWQWGGPWSYCAGSATAYDGTCSVLRDCQEAFS